MQNKDFSILFSIYFQMLKFGVNAWSTDARQGGRAAARHYENHTAATLSIILYLIII